MTDEKNKIVDILIEDFIKVLGISDKWEPDNNILLELKNMIDSLASVDIKSFEERKSSIFYFANKKLNLNKSSIKKFIDYVAKFKIYFNYHEKEIISSFTCYSNDSNNVCWLWYTGIQRFQER